jgi:sugar/nucleoside kinase (ribokinase family)
VLLEGYIYDLPQGPAAAAKAMELARGQGATVALSLSDAQCVARHHKAFADAVGRDVKLVVANETEIMSLFETESFEEACRRAARTDALFVLTRSEKGSVIVKGEQRVVQRAYPVTKVIDATGAGDAYSAGFLHGWTQDRPLAECADLGARCATAVIQQVGARLEKDAVSLR